MGLPANAFGLAGGTLVQPVTNVPAYLATRTPVADCTEEISLLITLPARVRQETKCLCSACLMVLARVNDGSKVQPACIGVLRLFTEWSWKLNTFRPKYDLWVKQKDWLVLVNRAKAGAAWIARDFGLKDVTLDFVAARCAEFKRKDALPEAVRSIHRQWKTGLNHRGEAQPVPGYDWENRNPLLIPAGLSIDNLRVQLKRRAKWLKVHKALAHEGIAAARKFIPQVRSTREGLRFMEEVQFDDVKCDFRIFDSATGQVMDLWLLIAHDRATGMLLGFGMRPARVREDGSQEHLKLRDMKQLCGWLLERYGLPPYLMLWRIERGAATMEPGTAQAIVEMLPERLKVSFTSMISGNSPSGYLERALGNSKGKASLESHNRQGHLIGAGLPGQTGPHYGVRPKDLAAREKECVAIWKAFTEFPAGLRERLRDEAGYPLLTLRQARAELMHIFAIRNGRTDHNLEGFEEVLEVLADGQGGKKYIKRMESPLERSHRLCAGLEFSRVSPEVIAAFYEHTQRAVTVTDAGEIEFSHESRKLTFANPGTVQLVPGAKALCYFHPDDPRYLHLTDGKGSVLGTWLRRALVRSGDRVALSEAIHHSESALKAAKATAARLEAGEGERLNAMREHNPKLIEANTFIEVSESRLGGRDTVTAVTSPVAVAMAGTPRVRQEMSELPPKMPPVKDCTDELLSRAQAQAHDEDEHWD